MVLVAFCIKQECVSLQCGTRDVKVALLSATQISALIYSIAMDNRAY